MRDDQYNDWIFTVMGLTIEVNHFDTLQIQ